MSRIDEELNGTELRGWCNLHPTAEHGLGSPIACGVAAPRAGGKGYELINPHTRLEPPYVVGTVAEEIAREAGLIL